MAAFSEPSAELAGGEETSSTAVLPMPLAPTSNVIGGSSNSILRNRPKPLTETLWNLLTLR